MSRNQTSREKEALVRELLAAIKANIPVAGGGTLLAGWRVMDRDCAERVKKAAAALSQLTSRDSAMSGAGDRPSSEALVQELLAAIEASQPIATGTGHCPDVPCFDRHDREAERLRPGWEKVEEDRAKRVERAAAALSNAVRNGRYEMDFKCPSCQGNSLEIDMSLELPPGDVDETSVQTVKCEACQFQGIAVYRESRRRSLSSESFDHPGYVVSDRDLEFVRSGLRLCPDRANKDCQCQTHLAWAQRDWSVPERDMSVKRWFRMDLPET